MEFSAEQIEYIMKKEYERGFDEGYAKGKEVLHPVMPIILPTVNKEILAEVKKFINETKADRGTIVPIPSAEESHA